MNKLAVPYQQQSRRTWSQSVPSNISSSPTGTQRQQQQLQRQQQHNNQQQQQQGRQRVQRPAARMPVSSAVTAPRTVVVGDMVVADDSDTEAEIVEDVDDDSDDDKPKVLRVITRKPARTPTAATAVEPAWHALLRRTPSSRTASIARTAPRVQQVRPGPQNIAARATPSPQQQQQQQQQQGGVELRTRPAPLRPSQAQLYGTASRIVRTTGGSPKPAVNVPAKVLVPRNRLLFPLVSRGGRVLPVASSRLPMGVAYRRQDAGDAPQVMRRVVVSAVGPLSPAESAVLDGVLDMLDEHRTRYGGIKAYMEKYGVTATDTFPDGFP